MAVFISKRLQAHVALLATVVDGQYLTSGFVWVHIRMFLTTYDETAIQIKEEL